jgi:hypothetical protein
MGMGTGLGMGAGSLYPSTRISSFKPQKMPKIIVLLTKVTLFSSVWADVRFFGKVWLIFRQFSGHIFAKA